MTGNRQNFIHVYSFELTKLSPRAEIGQMSRILVVEDEEPSGIWSFWR